MENLILSVASTSGTIAARLAQAIRQDIISGVLEPGSRLRVDELSTRYGVSHIPVREALLHLVGERLAVIEPHKGALLRPVTQKFVADIHDTRTAIESLLVRRAAENISAEECTKLDRYTQAYEQAAATRDMTEMATANMAFHSYIAKIADNAEASHLLEQGWDLVISLRNRFGIGEDRISQIIDQHRQITQAIKEGNTDLAVSAVQEHCESARDDLLTQMRHANS